MIRKFWYSYLCLLILILQIPESISADTNRTNVITTGNLQEINSKINPSAKNGEWSDYVKRYRVIMSSDFPPFPVTNSDPDDVQSMVRFLLYSNEFDVEGLIASAGTFDMVAEKKNILAVLDEYDKVDENLRRHDSRYPVADFLRTVTFEGKGNNNGIQIQWGCDKQSPYEIIGEGKGSEASNAIIAAADKPDPRPLWIGVWGGPREVAQAVWDVRNTRSERELSDFISKLRVFLIACQDATHEWLMKEFPDLFIIESRSTYQGMFGSGDRSWVETNIINNHGPLCAIYPPRAMGGPGVIEGDSPTFLHLVSANRGINDPDDPTQPGWGGKYKRKHSTNHWVDGPGKSSISRWKGKFQAEFKARADWCVQSYEAANHPPVIRLDHPNELQVKPGSEVKLIAQGTDPDGDKLTYRWWQNQEVDSYAGTVEIQDTGNQDASFIVPADAGKGETIHVICEVTDQGIPPLTRYQRVVVKIE